MKRAKHNSVVIRVALSLTLLLSLTASHGSAYASSLSEIEQSPVLSTEFYDMYPGKIDLGAGLSISLPSRALLLKQTDLNIMGYSSPIQIKRIYRSDGKKKGLFGLGWALAGLPSLNISEKKIILSTAYGISLFTRTQAGDYIGNNGLSISQEKSGYYLQAPDGRLIRFSVSGQLISKRDANKNLIDYHFDDKGLIEVVDKGASRRIIISYNKAGQISEIQDNSGRKVSYQYNDDGRLRKVIQPGQQKTSYRYQAGGLSAIMRSGHSDINVSYDSSDDGIVRKIGQGNDQWLEFNTIVKKNGLSVDINDSRSNKFRQSFSAEKGGVKVAITGKNGLRADYIFSSNFSLREANLPDGYSLSKQYDAQGRLIKVRDNRGRDTTLNYKSRSPWPGSIVDRQAGTVSFQYDSRNNLNEVKKNKHRISYDYSNTGKLLAVYDNKKKLTTYSYDRSGNQIKRASHGYLKTRKSYDVLGRVTEEKSNAIQDKAIRYDLSDRITRITSGKKYWLDFEYSTDSLLKAIISASGNAISYQYDNNGRPVSTILPDGSRFERQYQYKDRWQVVNTLFPGGNKTKLISDQLNRPVEFINSLGKKYRYKWTNSGKPEKIIYPDESSVIYSYDKTGRLVKSRYSDGTEESYRYDGSRLTQIAAGNFQQNYHYRQGIVSPVGFTDKATGLRINVEYSDNNSIRSISIPNAGKISYEYNRHGQLISVTDPRGKIYKYSYNKNGSVSQILYPNKVKQTVSVASDTGSVDSIKISNASSVMLKRKYNYQPNQLIAGYEDEDDSSVQYRYGMNDELVESTYVTAGEKENTRYRYDPNGNLSEEMINGQMTRYQYSGIGNLIKKNKQTFRYDQRGNLIEINDGSQRSAMSYTLDNKLASVVRSDGVKKEYRYDPFGHLVYVKQQGRVRHIIWNGDHRLLEVDEGGKIKKIYIYGQGVDQLLAIIENGIARYFHQDINRSAILVTNEQGESISRPEYSPYGEPQNITDDHENYWFSGRPYDAAINAYYLRARYYFPDLKRFGSRDPVSGDMTVPTMMNPYLYALNNPVNASDPGGKIFLELAATAAIAVISTGVIIYKVANAIGGGAGFSSIKDRGGDDFQAADVKGSTERLGRAVRDIQSHVNNLGGTSTLFTTGLSPDNKVLGFGLTAAARLGVAPIPVSNTPADLVLNAGMIDAMSNPDLSGSQQLAQGAAHLLNEGTNQLGTGLFVSFMNTGVLRAIPGVLNDLNKATKGILTRAGTRAATALGDLGDLASAGFQAATTPGTRQAAQTAAAAAAGTALSGAGSSANAQTSSAAAASKAAVDRFRGEVVALKSRCDALDTLRTERRTKLEDAKRLASEVKAAVSVRVSAEGKFLTCSTNKQGADKFAAKVAAIAPKAAQGNQGARSLLQRCNADSDLVNAEKLQKASGALAKEAAAAYQQLSAVLTATLPKAQTKAQAEIAKIADIKAKLNLAKVKSVTVRNYQDSARTIAGRVAELKSSCNNTYAYLSQEIQKRSEITGDAGFKTLLTHLSAIETTINTREYNAAISDNVEKMMEQANKVIANLPRKEAILNECISYDVVTPLLQAQVLMAQIKNAGSWDSAIASLHGQCRAKLDAEKAAADENQKPGTEGTEYEPPRDREPEPDKDPDRKPTTGPEPEPAADTGTGCKFRGRDGKCMDNVISGTPRGVGVGGTPVVVNPSGGADLPPEQGSTTGQSGTGTAFGTYGEDQREQERQDDRRAENQADVNRAQTRGRYPPGGRGGVAEEFGTPELPPNEPLDTGGPRTAEAGGNTSTSTSAGTDKPTGTKPPGKKPTDKKPPARRTGGSNSNACRAAVTALLDSQGTNVVGMSCSALGTYSRKLYDLLSRYERVCGRTAQGKDILLKMVDQQKRLCSSSSSSPRTSTKKPPASRYSSSTAALACRAKSTSSRKCQLTSGTSRCQCTAIRKPPQRKPLPPVVKCGKEQKKVRKGDKYVCQDLPCPAGLGRLFPGYACERF